MTSTYFEATTLPLDMKEQLCRDLLTEFGANYILHKASKNELVVRCVMPWHDDRRPSAGLNYDKLTYNCWSCGSGGGLLWFISTVRGTSGFKAREWVESRTDLGTQAFSLAQLLDILEQTYAAKPMLEPPMPHYSPRVLDAWLHDGWVHPWLTDPFDPADRSWGRGVPEENARALKIGYDTDGDRIVFPHFWKDRLVGWTSRRLLDDGTAKYLDTEDFPRASTLYHFDPDAKRGVLVEAPISVARHLHHQPMVASFGNEVTSKQVRLLGQVSEWIIFPDPDQAGWGMVTGYADQPGLVDRLQPYGNVRVVETDWYADPADLSEDIVSDLVDQAVPYALWQPPTELRCLSCHQCHGGPCAVA